MVLQRPPSVAEPRRPRIPAPAWLGATAVLAILGLVLTERADAGPALLCAALLAALAGWQTVEAVRQHRREALTRRGAGALEQSRGGPPFAPAFEVHPDPGMIVSAGETDDLASRRVLFANAAARELLRIPREGALLLSALRHPEVLEVVDESLFGGLTGSAAWETGGAQARIWRAWSTPVQAASAEPRLALLVIHEETDARAAERTRADFMANASHELRTPLASLAGFVEMLRGHAREDEFARERFLAIMADQAARMARLVDDLLSLSRIELNEHIPPAGVVDLCLAVVDVCDALGPLAREQRVTIESHLPPGPCGAVSGDRDQIVQVVQNLVDNAVKYSPDGATVLVEVAPDLTAEALAALRTHGAARLSLLTPDRPTESRYMAVRVTDAGAGMEREHLPRLTERFYRVEGQKSGVAPGTGLGLAIVKHVMNRHRGGLVVESAVGKGTTFTAYFPMVETRSFSPAEGRAAATGDEIKLS